METPSRSPQPSSPDLTGKPVAELERADRHRDDPFSDVADAAARLVSGAVGLPHDGFLSQPPPPPPGHVRPAATDGTESLLVAPPACATLEPGGDWQNGNRN